MGRAYSGEDAEYVRMFSSEELHKLVARGVTALRLDAADWGALGESHRGGAGFTRVFPTYEAQGTKRGSIVVFQVDADDDRHLRIGFIRSIQKVSTFDHRLAFEIIGRVEPHSLDALLSRLDAPTLRGALSAFEINRGNLQRFSPKLGEAVLRALAAIPANETPLRQVLSQLNFPRTFRTAEALQADAIKMALRAFGATRPEAVDIELSTGATALASVRLLEDAIIEHDARWVPGFDMTNSDVTGRATFVNRTGRLEIITANKRPLERLLGVDLIYFNQPHGALVMLQYKMMEKIAATGRSPNVTGEGWFVAIDSQFRDELARMRRFDVELGSSGPYRLNPGAFFVKMVKREASTSSSGIIITLAHLDDLMSRGRLAGPRGGLRISYEDLAGHYLRAEGFVELVRSGYIGTRGATTEHLKALIDAALTGRRGVVAAIQSAFGASGS
jgi:hypothetical protein